MKIEVKVFNDSNEKLGEHIEIIPEKQLTIPRFVALPDGWVRDLNQGLDFYLSSEKDMNYESAVKYCAEKGGRLPTRKELDNILDLTKKKGACIDTNYFKNTKESWYWTSTPVAWSSSGARWCVSFNYGYVFIIGESYCYYVRPCRASQC